MHQTMQERNEVMEEISVQEVIDILKKRMRMIILITIVAIVLAGIISFFILSPKYESFTTLMVGKSRDYRGNDQIDYDDLVLSQKLVHTYGALVESRDVSDKVIENLGLDMDYEELGNKIDVNLVEDTEIIRIKVTDKTPQQAMAIANETASVFMDSVVRLMNVENIQVIDEARIPERKVSPRPMMNMAIAGVLGVMLGVFGTFLIEFLDNTIKTSEDVERELELSTIGTIPDMNNKRGLVALRDPKSPIVEAFRTLRTNIQFSSIDKEIKVIALTSSGSGEGKSTVAANLASIIAQSDKRVLLIDADLRKPRIHEMFRTGNALGLTNVLVRGRDMKDVLYTYETLNNLQIITSGPVPPNPAELIGSNKMKEFIESIRDQYDVIIIDTPPVGLVTDSAVLSTLVDGIIMVAASGETNIDEITKGKESLDKVNANIMGVVLNKVPIDDSVYGYGYYGETSTSRRSRRKSRAT